MDISTHCYRLFCQKNVPDSDWLRIWYAPNRHKSKVNKGTQRVNTSAKTCYNKEMGKSELFFVSGE